MRSLVGVCAGTWGSLHWRSDGRPSCAASWEKPRIRIGGGGIPGSHYLRTMRTMPEMRQRRRPVPDVGVGGLWSVPTYAFPGVGQRARWRRVCGSSVPPWLEAAATRLVGWVRASACWVRACGARRRICIPARARGTAGMDGRLNTV